ncbi:MAG: hypothetical protein JRH20_13920 [Deltaproteobacteria bacterium]|nr:hypothetical protein [Deltaproteobacteria bacterium]
MSTRRSREEQRHKPPRREGDPQHWWEILAKHQRDDLPFANYFRELKVETHPTEMPWGGDGTLIEGWFTAGEELEEGAPHEQTHWPRDGSLARAWGWMCSHVLPAERTNPQVGHIDSDTD